MEWCYIQQIKRGKLGKDAYFFTGDAHENLASNPREEVPPRERTFELI
jgi:hypothetical protein